MAKNHISSLLHNCQKINEELCVVQTLVVMTKNTCLGYEFTGNNYNIPEENLPKLSKERNHYINMLSLLNDKISYIENLGILVEDEILENYPHNCCR